MHGAPFILLLRGKVRSVAFLNAETDRWIWVLKTRLCNPTIQRTVWHLQLTFSALLVLIAAMADLSCSNGADFGVFDVQITALERDPWLLAGQL